jgi:hypothetical protein
MRKERLSALELWATRSKAHAFGFLVGLALLISASLTGGAALLAMVVQHGIPSPAVAATPR